MFSNIFIVQVRTHRPYANENEMPYNWLLSELDNLAIFYTLMHHLDEMTNEIIKKVFHINTFI